MGLLPEFLQISDNPCIRIQGPTQYSWRNGSLQGFNLSYTSHMSLVGRTHPFCLESPCDIYKYHLLFFGWPAADLSTFDIDLAIREEAYQTVVEQTVAGLPVALWPHCHRPCSQSTSR